MPFVRVNGENRFVEEGERLKTLVSRLGLEEKSIVCEVNLTIVSRGDWESLILGEGDQVEIIGFVGGGSD